MRTTAQFYFVLVLIIIIFFECNVYSQFSREEICTDSSDIVIIINSEYKVFEETYKNKDSIWRSVRFIRDTSQIKYEGWKTKNDKYLGTWDEYTSDGELLYSRNYDEKTCYVNKTLHPYHDLLEKMKIKTDSLIIATYSNEFFENNVHFDFECNAYDDDGYVGSWIEPMKRKPTEFIFKYSVKLDSSDWYEKMIGIELDLNGDYVPNEGFSNNFGFERIPSGYKTFQINKGKAIETARNNGLVNSGSEAISEFLTWESFNKPEFYNGEFKYYIAEFVNEVKNINENGRSRIEYKYNVYYFNPWTGEFLGKKKMKQVKEWEKNSGFTTGLIPDE